MKKPKDVRSTGRKRGRSKLFKTGRAYSCTECGASPKVLPPDAPKMYFNFAPGKLAYSLQCNHINKNILDNDPANLEWLCASCHKIKDSTSKKGESTIEDEFGYNNFI